MSAPALLQLSGIGKSFGAVRVLDGISLTLHASEVHVLAGENGAGKSTLIKILGGVHTAYDGEITWRGQRVRFTGPADATRHGIALIHQEGSLVPSLSVVDNLHLGREPASFGGVWHDRGRALAAARAFCAGVGLDFSNAELNAPVERFSLAIRNRIEIAKALSCDARLLIMDEPTGALDRPDVDLLFDLIAELKAQGVGIVYISHRMEEIYRIADRITVLRDGRHVGTAAVEDCPEAKLLHWMLGRELDEQYPEPQKVVSRQPRLELRGFTVPHSDPARPPALSNFNLKVSAGEVVGIAGLQGSGNSELFHGLFDVRGRRCSGVVRIDGAQFTPSDPRAAVARGLAFVTADRKATGLVLPLSVAANINLASLSRLSASGLMRAGCEDTQAGDAVERFRIRIASLAQPVGTLSGGNQQKVVLAKWAATQPKILLLEEPTRGVDVGAKREIYRLIQSWAESGMAILLISSELPELLALSHRIAVLHRGKLTAVFDAQDVTRESILRAAMGAAA